MVNSELFRQIADAIEAKPESYDQAASKSKKTECGTAYCIGGLALLLSGLDPRNYFLFLGEFNDGCPSAQGLLSINNRDAETLFCEDWEPIDDLTVPEALRLIADGKSVAEVSHG